MAGDQDGRKKATRSCLRPAWVRRIIGGGGGRKGLHCSRLPGACIDLMSSESNSSQPSHL